MRHRYQLDIERPEREAAAERHDGDRDRGRPRLALLLGLEQRGGERRRVDRQLELGPEIEQRPEVVLVRMGEHETEEIAALLHEIADIRQNQIDAGQRIVTEGDAEVDRDPLPTLLVAEPVDREVHADLADPAQGREDELVGRARHGGGPVSGWFRRWPSGGTRRPPRWW